MYVTPQSSGTLKAFPVCPIWLVVPVDDCCRDGAVVRCDEVGQPRIRRGHDDTSARFGKTTSSPCCSMQLPTQAFGCGLSS